MTIREIETSECLRAPLAQDLHAHPRPAATDELPARSAATDPRLEKLRAYRNALYVAGKFTDRKGRSHSLWPSGITEPAGDYLRTMVVAEAPTRSLEIGLGLGMSALFLAEAHLELGDDASSVGSHTVIEPCPQIFSWAGIDNLEQAGVLSLVNFIHDDSSRALPRLLDLHARSPFDIAYVDGSHLFDGVFVDIFYTLRLVRPGGLIILDDLWMPAVRSALSFFAANLNLELMYPDPLGPGRRFIWFRVPEKLPHREWDHFAPFSEDHIPWPPAQAG